MQTATEVRTPEDEIAELKRKYDELVKVNTEFRQRTSELSLKVAEQSQTIIEQQEEIRILRGRKYGRSSEKLPKADEKQPSLFNEAETSASPPGEAVETETVRITKTEYTRAKGKPGRKPLPAHLARIDIVVDLSDEEKIVPPGYELLKIGEETNEQVHEIPQKMVVIRTVRAKYFVKPLKGSGQVGTRPEFRIASVPPRILPKSIATPSLLAYVLTGKFCESLPFYRQETIFKRYGLEISRQDMANWAMSVSDKLDPLMGLMKEALLSGPCLHCDETYFQVMDEEEKANTTKSYMWVMTGGPPDKNVVLYRYHASREADFISKFLATYCGFLHTDGYAGYNAIGDKEGIIHVACWAHARRKFVEASIAAQGKGRASEAITFIAKLYHIEHVLRKTYQVEHGTFDVTSFLAERKKDTLLVFDLLKTWLEERAVDTLPTSALGKAVSYALSLWPRLLRYVDCPWLTPDNNEAERAIRPFTIGRKNWVLSGSPRGAKASANLYSFIETAKANGLDPYYYLRYVLTKLPTLSPENLESLLPWNVDVNDFHSLIKEDVRISLGSTIVTE